MEISKKEYLTFDDVNIVPKYSEIQHRGNCITTTHITLARKLHFPIVSAPMDTVTDFSMAIALWEVGGLGFIHRFMPIKEQAMDVGSIKDYIENFSKQMANDEPDYTVDFPIEDSMWFMNPPIAASIGVTGDYLERAHELVKQGANILLLDVAHGNHVLVKNALCTLHNQRFSHTVEFIAGNVATTDGARNLIDWGAHGIRVGLGNGSLCETRIRTGIGVPQVSALMEINEAVQGEVPIIGDGGCRMIGDVCKALVAGADTVMLGSLLAGTRETPGRIIRVGQWPNEKLYKKYQGSASIESKIQRNEDEKNVEGNSKLIHYKGKVKRILKDIRDGLSSSMSYIGVDNIYDYKVKAELIKVTTSSHIEGLPHLMIGE